jgi:hypothetical protein
MTTLPDLHSLRASIAAATGPDRELDTEIHALAGFCLHPRDQWKRSGAQSDTGFTCKLCGADSWGNLGKNGERFHDVVPSYTDPAYIGAVIGLIRRECCHYELGEHPTPFCAVYAYTAAQTTSIERGGTNVSLAAIAAFVDAMIWKAGAK